VAYWRRHRSDRVAAEPRRKKVGGCSRKRGCAIVIIWAGLGGVGQQPASEGAAAVVSWSSWGLYGPRNTAGANQLTSTVALPTGMGAPGGEKKVLIVTRAQVG